MKCIDFRGARGSNTGDDFHELWATRQAIRLLSNEDGLEAIAVEGLSARDEAGAPPDTWDGVDCTLYFGGRDATEANHIRIEQLKYSAAYPNKSWTIARLVAGRRGRSVIARLAKAWKGLTTPGSKTSYVRAILISNQPVDEDVLSAVQRATASSLKVPKPKPTATAAPEIRLAYATGLDAEEFRAFASALHIGAGAGSRFALEERALQAIAEWTDQDVQGVATGLRQFIRRLMMPECVGETITRESVLLHFGASEESVLFPCPSEITATESPVRRAPVREAVDMLRSGVRYLCLHGRAGVGKTTALQEIEEALPPGSIMVKYDCYGGGRYLDPSALRHRSRDAFVQLSNELAARIGLPLLLSPHHGSDFPRLFANRLKHAAHALAAQHPDALIVVAIDAADNAVRAAQEREPPEPSFVHDFVQLTEQPENVRFVVTARTGRRGTLQLPRSYSIRDIEPFSRKETSENVARVWAAPDSWIDDFHHFSSGIPRVQTYAFEVDGSHPSTALDRLRPDGKVLGDIFRQQFDCALTKSGTPAELARLCAALITLPRPIPLSDLAAILDSTEPQLADICADLAPGIRLQDGAVGFADEDFEEFVRAEGEGELAHVRARTASRLLPRADHDCYAALHVAAALVAAGRGDALLQLVERESAPSSVADPVLRREAELQRLRLAIKVCREAGNVARALRFVLIGAEGVKTETALRGLLMNNPDLAARSAPETARRLILSDADCVEDHGPLLFHKLSVDADRGDAISYREGLRFLQGWLQARTHHYQNAEAHQHRAWKISISDISSAVEAALKLEGPAASLRALQAWRPKRIGLEVGLTLPYRLIAEGRGDDVEAFVTGGHLGPLPSLFLLVPLALAGRAIDIQRMACGLERLRRRKLRVKRFFRTSQTSHDTTSSHAQVLETVLTACEILTIKRAAPELVDRLLADFLDPEQRRIDRRHAHETVKLDLLFRAYALRETRAGRIPDAKTVFEPRPPPTDERSRHQQNEAAERHDRPLRELMGVVFDIYATVANALVNRPDDAELEEDLRQALGRLEREKWRVSREHHAEALRRCAATSLLVLLAAGHAPPMVKRFAADVHGRWRNGVAVPDDRFVARLSLWPCLHGPLLEDLAAAAAETRTMRLGADEKSTALVSYARLVKPLSKPDANAIFNTAVEVASELDHEAMAQIRLLDELGRRGSDHCANARSTARKLGNIVADAAIRLEGNDHFPWEQAMAALARLDAPLALANAARWDDEAVASLHATMAPVLKTALDEGTIRPEQAAALSMLTDDGGAVITEILKQSGHEGHPSFPALVEEAAYEVLIRHALRGRQEVVHCIEQHGPAGPWSDSLLRQDQFVATLTPESAGEEIRTLEPDTNADADAPVITYVWSRETLLDSSLLQEAVQHLWDRMRAERRYYRRSFIFDSARQAVSPADRVAHIAALAGLDASAATTEAVEAMLQAADEWWTSPSVQEWCRTKLPEVIVTWFPTMTRYLPFAEDYLTPALKRTGLDDARIQDLLLKGLERHADGMGADLIFSLAAMIGCKLTQSDAARLTEWYTERLANRISIEYQDQAAPDSAIPPDVDEAVARVLFAYMGDCDLRLRWRAAHAVRRLARTEDKDTLAALVAEYSRREERVFRGHDFYWLAARLWFVLAWDRVAGERSELAGQAGPTLLRIALDDTFPHLLVRSFARDACAKLVAAGRLVLTTEDTMRLAHVNESPVPRVPAVSSVRNTVGFGHGADFAYRKGVRRFEFDPVDTLPYWYAPMLQLFSAVDGDRFLQQAERWIVDDWGYSGEIRAWDKEPRRIRLSHRNWSLVDHRHGSTPTLERLHTHLEWHAMWCATGELLKTEPLVPQGEDNWHELSEEVDQEKLVEPPLWSADLLVPKPLLARYWRPDKGPLEDWALGVREPDHRAEMFPSDSPNYVAVDGSSERRMSDRIERTRVSSALVGPATGRSLLRALQTMADSWDYKLPDEGEQRAEIDEAPYCFLGWLRHPNRDGGIDKKDPFRGHAFQISSRPGQRVAVACDLARDKAGRPCWSSGEAEQPMFVYEAWGVDAEDEERYRGDFAVCGQRLLAHREQVLSFLRSQGLDLVIEVEVTRRERRNRRFTGEEEGASLEGRFARLYLLDGEGNLEVAEGRLGTWTGDCPTA